MRTQDKLAIAVVVVSLALITFAGWTSAGREHRACKTILGNARSFADTLDALKAKRDCWSHLGE